jgi:hypothetical protein
MALVHDGITIGWAKSEIFQVDVDMEPEQFSQRILMPAWAAIRNIVREEKNESQTQEG